MKFIIDQITLYPQNPDKAIALLTEMGMSDWARDHICATSTVFCGPGVTEANSSICAANVHELEVLNYNYGQSWMGNVNKGVTAACLSMNVTEKELDDWMEFFSSRGILCLQAALSHAHSSAAMRGKVRRELVFDTRRILSIDVRIVAVCDIPSVEGRS